MQWYFFYGAMITTGIFLIHNYPNVLNVFSATDSYMYVRIFSLFFVSLFYISILLHRSKPFCHLPIYFCLYFLFLVLLFTIYIRVVIVFYCLMYGIVFFAYMTTPWPYPLSFEKVCLEWNNNLQYFLCIYFQYRHQP